MNRKRKRKIEFRIIEDCCSICAYHAGHYFRGKHLLTYQTRFDEIDFYIDERGFICTGEIWICPECLKALKEVLNLLS